MSKNVMKRMMGLKKLGILLILFGAIATAQTLAQTEERELFLKAQETYQLAQKQSGHQRAQAMLKAAAQFEVLTDKHSIENGYLFYNIGNCYYEAGESGKAVLYYLKAKRLIPGFKDLENNLEVARAELNAPEAPKTWWSDIIQGIFFWHYMLDYSTRRILFIVSFSLIWLFLLTMIFLRSFLLKGGVILSLLLTLFFGGSYLMSLYQLHFIESGVIVNKEAVVRKGPGITYEKYYEQPLPGGTEFRILETRDSWRKIRLNNDDEVWIKTNDTGLI